MAACLLAVAVAAALLLRPERTGPPPSPPAPPARPLPAAIADAPAGTAVVLWSAQAMARFEPCGCVAGMNGGLMRRAPLLHRLPPDRVLSLELGGWSGGPRAHEMLRSIHYLRGLAAAGIDAVAIGAAEAALGRERLAALAAEAGLLRLPVLCANLDGPPGCSAALATTAAGRAILLTAVVPADVPGARDPAEALAALAAQAAHDGRDLVCMADLDPEACRALAKAVPQLAVVVGGRAEHPSPGAVAVGRTRVLWAGNHGKVLGSWAWGSAAASFELLADTLPEDPAQRGILAAYQQALAGIDIDTAGGMRTLGLAGFAGSGACAACHTDAARIHGGSRHRQAFAALVAKGYQHDPDCLRCHVTGMGEGGWQRGADAFAEVGCEACHGPGEAHMRAAAAGRAGDARLTRLSPASCIACHDADNSPHFDHGRYWSGIQHGLDRRLP